MSPDESVRGPRLRPEFAEQLRRALLLSLLPLLVGLVVVLVQLVEGQWYQAAPRLLFSLGLAWFIFLLVVLGLSVVLSFLRGPALALRTTVACPRCKRTSLIISYSCSVCDEDLGVPGASRPTCAYTLIGFLCFKVILLFQPQWWLF